MHHEHRRETTEMEIVDLVLSHLTWLRHSVGLRSAFCIMGGGCLLIERIAHEHY